MNWGWVLMSWVSNRLRDLVNRSINQNLDQALTAASKPTKCTTLNSLSLICHLCCDHLFNQWMLNPTSAHYLIGIYGRFFFGLACVSVIRSFLSSSSDFTGIMVFRSSIRISFLTPGIQFLCWKILVAVTQSTSRQTISFLFTFHFIIVFGGVKEERKDKENMNANYYYNEIRYT